MHIKAIKHNLISETDLVRGKGITVLNVQWESLPQHLCVPTLMDFPLALKTKKSVAFYHEHVLAYSVNFLSPPVLCCYSVPQFGRVISVEAQ